MQLMRTFLTQWKFESEFSCRDVLVFVKQKFFAVSKQAGRPALKEKSKARPAGKLL